MMGNFKEWYVMLVRPEYQSLVATALGRSPLCYLAGPRQVGKTTLARTFLSPDSPDYFDLEDPVALRRLEEPMTALGSRGALTVIDEVQRMPGLFPILRVLVDRDPARRFLILGSSAPGALEGVTESLAGRVERVLLPGFALAEAGLEGADRLWFRGGFPRAFLAASDRDASVWQDGFILSMTERDLPRTGLRAPGPGLLRFWTMLAHAQGSVWNASDPARSLGFSETTVRKYLEAWEGLFLVRVLQPWHENLSKRQVKAPKVYVRDTGLFHSLLGIRSLAALLSHPKAGASWETFALEEAIRVIRPDREYFWATHGGAELDLLILKDGKRLGFEFKRAYAPSLTASMRSALADLALDFLWVIYPGDRDYALGERARAWPFARIGELGIQQT